MADKRRPGPGLRQRHPKVKADRIGAEAAPRQDCGGEPLPLHRFLPHRRQQRIGGAIGDPARRQRDVTGDAITVAVRTADANSQPERASGTTT